MADSEDDIPTVRLPRQGRQRQHAFIAPRPPLPTERAPMQPTAINRFLELEDDERRAAIVPVLTFARKLQAALALKPRPPLRLINAIAILTDVLEDLRRGRGV